MSEFNEDDPEEGGSTLA